MLFKKANKYFADHILFTSVIHALGGVGFGIIIARPFVDHPIRVGLILLGLATLGHIYAFYTKS